jgi:hypothetical protein
VSWEHRTWAKSTPETKGGWRVMLVGEKGTMEFSDKGWTVLEGEEVSGQGSEFMVAHVTNFRDAIRGDAKLNSDIEEGHKSTRLCHLGNIAYRLGKTLTFDAPTETIPGDEAANRMLGREYRAPFALPAVV